MALLNGKLNDVLATFTLQVKRFKYVTQQNSPWNASLYKWNVGGCYRRHACNNTPEMKVGACQILTREIIVFVIHWLLLSKSSLSNFELKGGHWAILWAAVHTEEWGQPLGFPHTTQHVPSPPESPKLKKKLNTSYLEHCNNKYT